MIVNYLKVVIRNFFSDGMYTAIIVVGLAVGIAVSLIILQYVHFELSFDKLNKDNERIFYTYMNWQDDQGVSDQPCHPAVAPLIKQSIPEVESVLRMTPAGLNRGDEWILRREKDGTMLDYDRIDHMYLADPEIFDFFSIPLLVGDPNTALKDPFSVVLTRSVAEKFFPNESPLNKTLKVITFEFTVTGIIEDPVPNSTLQYNAFFSMNISKIFWGETYLESNWTWNIFQTFIKLRPGTERQSIEEKINNSAALQLARLQTEYDIKQSIHLYPFQDFHFYKPYNSAGVSPVVFTGDKRILGFFAAIAGLIMIISWANYINLTIAKALSRAKEVGLRKVSGAGQTNLISQFLLEFLFLNSIGLLVAITITQLLFDTFAAAIGSQAAWTLWEEPWFWLLMIGFLLVSTFASGIYPAFVLSNYNPIKVLKGNFSRSLSGKNLRKSLILIQFGLSAFLLMSIYVISRQLIFMQTKDLGMSIEQVLVVRLDELDTALNRNAAFEQLVAKIQNRSDFVTGAAVSNYPGDKEVRHQQYCPTTRREKKIFLEANAITADYFKTMHIKLLHGRTFRDDLPGDSAAVVINLEAAHELGFEDPESALGQKVTFTGDEIEFEIIGIVNDFTASVKQPAYGSIFHKKAPYNFTHYFVLRLATANLSITLTEIEADWKTLFSNAPFDYFFLDTYFDTFYKEERQFAGVFGFFSVVGVVITCMGLFGLSMYNTTSRTKEIGIRKSLGGSSRGIIWLFAKEYLNLVLLAGVISIPIGAWLLNNWLKNYPNRIEFSADFIIVPVLLMVLIAQFTVGYQTFKAAHSNPVMSLRNE